MPNQSQLQPNQTQRKKLSPGGIIDMEGYDLETFRLAVVKGQHPDGDPLKDDMPRWDMDDQDLADLAEFLQSLP